MQLALTILTILTTLFGVASVIQFLVSMATGSSLRARAQSSYNNWQRVAEIADQIAKEPSKAAELIRHIHGLADSARNEVKAYSREKLGFVPWFDPAYKGGEAPAPPVSFWRKVKSAFTPK